MLGSGTTSSGSKRNSVPSPSHLGQAPAGALKENSRGSISSMLKPDTGQAKRAEKTIRSCVSFLLRRTPSSRSSSPSVVRVAARDLPGSAAAAAASLALPRALLLARRQRPIGKFGNGNAVRQFQRGLETVGQTRANLLAHHDPVHHHVDVVLVFL